MNDIVHTVRVSIVVVVVVVVVFVVIWGHTQTMWTGLGGGGVSEKSTLVYNPYRVKWSTKGGGGVKNLQKMVHMVCV